MSKKSFNAYDDIGEKRVPEFIPTLGYIEQRLHHLRRATQSELAVFDKALLATSDPWLKRKMMELFELQIEQSCRDLKAKHQAEESATRETTKRKPSQRTNRKRPSK